jgi:Tol biopolymer transport system component
MRFFFSALLVAAVPLAAGAAPPQLLSGLPFVESFPVNGHSFPVAASGDGRFLVVETVANNLLAGWVDVNEGVDLYLYDRAAGSYELITRSAVHLQRSANHHEPAAFIDLYGGSSEARISEDGRWVAFTSPARDLVAGISFASGAELHQVYLFDRASREVRLVSHFWDDPTAAAEPEARLTGISADGRWVAFDSPAPQLNAGGSGGVSQVYLYDRDSGQHRLVSHPAGAPGTPGAATSESAELSPDGRWLLFTSSAPDLVAGQVDPLPGVDVFLYDRQSGLSELISRSPGNPLQAAGGSADDLSPDGRFVALHSHSTGLVAGIADGNGNERDCFVFDRQAGSARLASPSAVLPATSSNGSSLCQYLSSDGRRVFMDSAASDLVAGFVDRNGFRTDVYFFDGRTGGVVLISHLPGQPAAGGNLASSFGPNETRLVPYPLPPALDGRYTFFRSRASDLVAGIADTFDTPDLVLHDLAAGSSTLLTRYGDSPAAGGCPGGNEYRAILTAAQEVFFSCSQPLDPAAPANRGMAQVFRLALAGDGGPQLFTRTPLRGLTTVDTVLLTERFLDPEGLFVSLNRSSWNLETGEQHLFAHALGAPATPANGNAWAVAASADGRYFAHYTSATNIAAVADVNNTATDVYVYDRQADVSILVSHGAGDPLTTANRRSVARWMSPDGQQLVFESEASNLVAAYTGEDNDPNIYFHDRSRGTTELVSHGHTSPTVSGLGDSDWYAMTLDRLGLLYTSTSQALVPGFADANGSGDNLYYHDRRSGLNLLVDHRTGAENEGSAGSPVDSPQMTADGSSVFFSSVADDLVAGQVPLAGQLKTFRWNRATRQNELLIAVPGDPARPCAGFVRLNDISPDGRYVLVTTTCALVPGDANTTADAYLYDRQAQAAILISHQPGDPGASAGVEATALDLAAGARRIVYHTLAATYGYDRDTTQRTPLLVAYYDPEETVRTFGADFSSDGGRILMTTFSPKVAPFDSNGKEDVFFLDLDRLFADGFESSDTSAWSQTTP